MSYLDDNKCEELYFKKKPKVTDYIYKSIVAETSKAWLLRMSGDAHTWFPKRYCTIDDTKVYVPLWLVDKMIDAHVDAKIKAGTLYQ